MKEGWCKERYFILFNDSDESLAATQRYCIPDFFPNLYVVGLLGWDDFILCSSTGEYSTVPTIPLVPEFLAPFEFPMESMRLEIDPRYEKRIKWYVKPLVFGGSPIDESNIVWVTHKEHAILVKWWNELYRKTGRCPV